VKVTDRSGASDGAHYNREHTWPNSHGFNDTNGLDANGNAFAPYTDTHMLYLSAADFNANRGNDPYGNTGAGATENATDAYGGFGGGTGTYPGNSNWDGTGVYEVWGHRKGDAARAVLYMDIRYEGGNASVSGPTLGQAEPDLIVTDNAALIVNTASGVIAPTGYMGLKTALEQWHQLDPPDAAEQLRNDIIYGYQGNRNPFIDHPEWVACLFECSCSVTPPPDAIFKDSFE
jgi:endonuclease I